jgi:hypothetical protein
MRTTETFVASIFLTAGLALTTGCASDDSVSVPSDGDWIDNPGQVEGALAAVGTQIFVSNEGNARTGAEADARAKLAATLKAEINQLVENWAKEAGDLQIQDSLSSLINNETFTRQYVDTVIRGATAYEYQRRENTVYCLMLMQPEKVAEWYDEMSDALEKEAMRDAALWKTEAMKSEARDRFDKIKEERKQEHIDKIKALRGDAGS